MKKIIFIIITCLLLTGCNSYMELNSLGIINKIGIEHFDKYKLYASIITNLDENLHPEERIYIVDGENIPELINNLSLTLNKKIYLSHLDLLIINNSIKTLEIKDLINFFLDNNETRETTTIVSTDNILDLITNSEFQEINNLIDINIKETSKSLNTTIFDIAKNYYLHEDIYIQNIKYDDTISLNGITKIHNNKLELITNENSIFINYLLNNINSYKENLICNDNKYLYLEILSSNTTKINNQLIITNEIKVINDDCKLNKKKIDKLFSNYLETNLSLYTKYKIKINNTIRGLNENY